MSVDVEILNMAGSNVTYSIFFKVSIGCWFIALTGAMASKIVN